MISDKKVVCTIVARGSGSSLYRKNLYRLCGKPVIAWALEILRETNFVTDIVVWSEDAEIKTIAETYGAVHIPRPKTMVHYFSGFHTLEEWYLYRHAKIQEALGYTGDYEMGFNCNNILLRPASLDAMFRLLVDNEDWACRVQGVVPVDPGFCLESGPSGTLFPFWNDPDLPLAQHPPLFRLMGVGIGNPFLCSHAAYSPVYHQFRPEEGFDFQNEEDIPFAEFGLGRRHGRLSGEAA